MEHQGAVKPLAAERGVYGIQGHLALFARRVVLEPARQEAGDLPLDKAHERDISH